MLIYCMTRNKAFLFCIKISTLRINIYLGRDACIPDRYMLILRADKARSASVRQQRENEVFELLVLIYIGKVSQPRRENNAHTYNTCMHGVQKPQL